MLKRFFTAFFVTTLITGGYFYYLKTAGIQVAADNNSKSVNLIEPAAGSSPAPAASDITAAVPFELTDQDGKKVTEKDLAGKKLLVYFGFTDCKSVCPVGMAVLTEVMNQLETEKAADIKPVFISINPETDTPAKLKTFLKPYYKGFTGLTGSKEEIEKVKKSFHVYAETPDKTADHADHTPEPNHSNLIYYMDQNGKYLTHFDGGAVPEDIVDYISSH